MGAIGFLLMFAAVVRVIFDRQSHWPINPRSRARWGFVILCGSGLMVASIVKALWEYMP